MTDFTPKHPAILDLMQTITGKPRTDGECVFDGQGEGEHNLDFDSLPPAYAAEFGISGMCATCQDGVFG